MKSDIAGSLRAIQEKIKTACERYGRSPGDVTLLAVSKGQPLEKVSAMAELGVDNFGENYQQEFEAKKLNIPNLKWHFIGQLQSNKLKKLVGQVSLIQSVAKPEHLDLISRLSLEKGIQQSVLLQMNFAGEESKSGFLNQEILQSCALTPPPGVLVKGLMVIPPIDLKDTELENYFQEAAAFHKKLNKMSPNFVTLSMGMTSDFELAINAGSTMVRIGTALFGPRKESL